MKNLKLLSKLQSSEMVTLVLIDEKHEKLHYYIVARSINYSIIASGVCKGTIPGGRVSFNILLSSLYPLLDKGYSFHISYENEVLAFETDDQRLRLTPLCVPHEDPSMDIIVARYLRLEEAIKQYVDFQGMLHAAEAALQNVQRNYNSISKMKLEAAMTSANPFGDIEDTKPSEVLENEVREKRAALEELKRRSEVLKFVELKAFRSIALAASRTREMIHFCESYAVLALKNTFVIQKGACPTMAVQGSLFNQLLSYSDSGNFLWFENGLVYKVDEKNDESTTVFMEKYLPNTPVDSSIITRGAVKERCDLSMKGILSVTQLMRSKFPQITMEISEGRLVMENDRGEKIITKFDVEKYDSADLKKLARGELSPEKLQMAAIDIPTEVQPLIGLFRDKVTIYIKARKVIFQSGDLYLVFGR